MKVRVALTEAAQEERLKAVRFARAFKHELAVFKERPQPGAPYLEGTRQITILAVAHHSLDPEYWVGRVRQRQGG